MYRTRNEKLRNEVDMNKKKNKCDKDDRSFFKLFKLEYRTENESLS